MKFLTALFITLALAACAHNHGACGCKHSSCGNGDTLAEPLKAPETLEVTSDDFTAGEPLATKHVLHAMGCTGGNVRPTLRWSNAPADTKSFAVILHDPDAPTGVGFFHWVVADLPATTTELLAGALPTGAIEGLTDIGAPGYIGPCPPPGLAHRYIFTVYALDVQTLGVDKTVTGAHLRFALGQHVLAFGRLTGTYQRSDEPTAK